jgi:hypothetical protein
MPDKSQTTDTTREWPENLGAIEALGYLDGQRDMPADPPSEQNKRAAYMLGYNGAKEDHPSETTAVLTDRYQIVVEHVEGGTTTHGRFSTQQAGEEFAMQHRDKLGLTGCLSWSVQHADA